MSYYIEGYFEWPWSLIIWYMQNHKLQLLMDVNLPASPKLSNVLLNGTKLIYRVRFLAKYIISLSSCLIKSATAHHHELVRLMPLWLRVR